MTRTTLLASLLCTLAFAACGEENPDEEACEHLAGGPAQALTAGASTTEAPDVRLDHNRYDVTLIDVTGGKGGQVKLESAEHGTYIVALDADVPVIVKTADNGVLPLITEKNPGPCPELVARYQFDLNVGTYFISFGPTAVEKVGLVLEQGVHAH